jgi:hypothetical protein
MIVSDAMWAHIRKQFTEEEKQQLRDAYLGETICPRGIVIDEAWIGPALMARLKEAKAVRS